MDLLPRLTDLPIVGDLITYERDRIGFLVQMAQEHGSLFRYGEHVYVVAAPDIAEGILLRTNAEFLLADLDLPAGIPRSELVVREQLEQWRSQRGGLLRGLRRDRINCFSRRIIDLTEDFTINWYDGQSSYVYETMKELVVRISADFFFGVDGVALVPLIAAFVDARFRYIDSPYTLPKWLPTVARTQLRRAATKLERELRRLITTRRVGGEIDAAASKPSSDNDLLTCLLATPSANGERLPDELVCYGILVLLFQAIHPATAALSWIWYLLACHARVERSLHAEIDRMWTSREHITESSHLPYVEAVVKEALRLYPPVWQLARDVHRDCTLGGYACQKGERLLINAYLLHRDAASFSRPSSFLPERWLNIAEPTRGEKLPAQAEGLLRKGSYVPLGLGPHKCLGSALAITELCLVLATIARRVRLVMPPSEPSAMKTIRLDPRIVLRPQGLPLVVERRLGNQDNQGGERISTHPA